MFGMYTAAFDLEGPLSPQDNAYEVMQLIENGRALFEVISEYDDYLALQGRQDYEPGDTLKLIVPFMLVSETTEDDIQRVSKSAKIVPGAKKLIMWLQDDGWDIHIISTSYEQHAYSVASRLGVDREKVHCTRFPLDSFVEVLGRSEKELIKSIEEEILSFHSNSRYEKGTSFKELADRLDSFFFDQVPRTSMKAVFEQISVVGGERKIQALMRAIGDEANLQHTAVVGDSITDYKMLQKVRRSCGLSVVFNGNDYALPYGNIAMACSDIRPIYPIFSAFRGGGLDLAFSVAALWENTGEVFMKDPEQIPDHFMRKELKQFFVDAPNDAVFPRFNLLKGKTRRQLESVSSMHGRFRNLVRGKSAAKLG
ncbi:MAG: hypothetical protein LUP95_04935 [Euryarchaeota archaeon]|nr:hypothetical protein [Euryarchaeota archaeon]